VSTENFWNARHADSYFCHVDFATEALRRFAKALMVPEFFSQGFRPKAEAGSMQDCRENLSWELYFARLRSGFDSLPFFPAAWEI